MNVRQLLSALHNLDPKTEILIGKNTLEDDYTEILSQHFAVSESSIKIGDDKQDYRVLRFLEGYELSDVVDKKVNLHNFDTPDVGGCTECPYPSYTISIHYAKVDLVEDIPCYEFETEINAFEWVLDILHGQKNNVVYLVSINDEVVVTDDNLIVAQIFSGGVSSVYPYTGNDIFIQEYKSFETAYRVALAMKETNPKCYD